MMTRYQFDPHRSRFTVQAFAAGMLSFLGHSPTFAVREFTGALELGNAVEDLYLEVSASAAALQLVDNVSAGDRREIEGTMRRDVLEVMAYPVIRYQATEVAAERVAAGRYRLRLNGPLALHGVTRPQRVEAELLVFRDGVRLSGESVLRLSDHRIQPVTALGGTIRLKDELKIAFDLVGLPEES